MKRAVPFLLLILLGLFDVALGQSFVTRGKDFWLAFPSNTSGTANLRINIAADAATTGTLSSGIGWTTGFSVNAGAMTTITVPNTHMVTAFETIESKGIHIVSADTVTINASWVESGGGDAILVYPTPCLGASYYILTHQNLNPAAFVITATQNSTVVTITPKFSTTTGRAAGVPFSVTLNAGQTYRVGSNSDFSGSKVTSSAPIVVAGTNHCAQVPTGTSYCDMIWEQLLPVNHFGQYFVTGYMEGRTPDIDVFRILSTAAGTGVYINGSLVATLADGAFYETSLSGGNIITTTQNAVVMQYTRGSAAHGGNGDPCMVWLPPVNLFSKRYYFNTMEAGVITSHWITIYTKTSNTSLARLDGALIPALGWNAVAGSPWSYKVIGVATGLHTLSSDSSICGITYGWGAVTSYGYPMGGSFTPIVLSEDGLNLFGWYDDSRKTILQWNSQKAVSNHFFGIERSLDGVNWNRIHEMSGANGDFWRYEDQGVLPGSTYRYRVLGRDLNGTEQYSDAITVRTSSDLQWNVYPTLFSEEIFLDIALEEDGWFEVALVNTAGQQVFSTQLLGHQGTQTFDIHLPGNLSAGTYFAVIKTTNQRFSQTIQKQ